MRIPRVTALVPMKHHSERVPDKNFRSFCGKPLLHWILRALTESRYVTSVVVNTDSDLIAHEASERGATILHRPRHLLGDMIGIQPLIAWDLAHSDGEFYLQTHSTNPLLTADTINRAITCFFDHPEHDSLFSVTRLRTRLYWPDGRPINHDPDRLVRTQDLPPLLEENSCIYLFSRQIFATYGHRIGGKPLMFSIDPLEAIDIDDECDFLIAQAVMSARLSPPTSVI